MFTILMTLSMLMSVSTILFMNNSTTIYMEFNLLHCMNLNLIISWTNMLFCATVLFITSMVMQFSKEYIPKKEHNQFFLLTFMFMISMIILMFSNNLIMLMIGWDGLGLTSYALVIYYQNMTSNAAGTLTILSNRVGDLTLILTIALLTTTEMWNLTTNANFPILALLLILTAAVSKSAQMPFSSWLPAAMAAPTPISALVHSSTLVTAGVYLMTRINYPWHPSLSWLLLIISTTTLLMASIQASWEQDLKKIVALSTLSQIAIMMLAASLNMTTYAFFHLITHALFKSTMFLCVGMIIHQTAYQDMRHMSSMYFSNPVMTTVLGITTMALMGLPFMAGFYSKDAIMEMTLYSNLNLMLMILMLLSLGMTASYSLRMFNKSLQFKTLSKPDYTTHESPSMNKSILLMAPFCMVSGNMLMWKMNSYPTLMMSNFSKTITWIMIALGALIGISLSFKSEIFLKLGKTIQPMWFMNNMSTTPFLLLTKNSMMIQISDMTWHEKMISSQMLYSLKTNIMYVMKMKTLSLMTLTLILLIPMILLY